MSLTDRLEKLTQQRTRSRREEVEKLLAENAGKLLRASELPDRSPAPRRQFSLLEALAGSTRISNRHGDVICVRSELPVQASLGEAHPRGYRFSPPPQTPENPAIGMPDILALFAGDELLRNVPLERLAFLDIETTGLMGATGVYPFLVGLGYFESSESRFVCEQFFMQDYPLEPALLAHLMDRLDGFDAFVTFNGKTFDVPVLRARCILNRIPADLERPHLDLLHMSRRIYRRRIGSCSLGSIEKAVLQLGREHDVDGSLVPGIYFDFLRGMWPERLIPVFDHNAQDVISMGALLLLLAACAQDPEHHALHEPEDLLAFGRFFHRQGWTQAGVRYFERCCRMARDESMNFRAIFELALAYKRLGRHKEASEMLESECRRSGLKHPAAWVELAKLYEHHLSDFQSALSLIQDAEQQARLTGDIRGRSALETDGTMELLADFARRKQRLTDRMAKANARKRGSK